MIRKIIFLTLIAALPSSLSFAAEPESSPQTIPKKLSAEEAAALPPAMRALLPLHQPKGMPEPGDWLDRHQERGGNYRQYVEYKPIRATADRRSIYIQPLGKFSAEQQKTLDLSAEFLKASYQLPVKMNKPLDLKIIPANARRNGPRGEQIRSIYVLDQVLKPRLPRDAAVFIGFTATDLWPGEGWNFVFGQASLNDRVGVWSLNRFGDPAESDEAFQLTLHRTLRTAVHETGHMFSVPHCIYFECCMNGSNHLTEADSQPLWLCPQCQAKLNYATGADAQQQFKDLIAFARKHGLDEEREFWERSLKLVEGATQK